MKKSVWITLFLLPSFFLGGCSGEDGEEGKVIITLNTDHLFPQTPTQLFETTLSWGCLVISESKTACIYYYNGVLQTDSTITDTAKSFGPGTDGFTFVGHNEAFSDLEGGTRTWSQLVYNSLTSPSTTPTTGTIDFPANEGEKGAFPAQDGDDGEDSVYTLRFNTVGDPTLLEY